jgi:hypothetical protein
VEHSIKISTLISLPTTMDADNRMTPLNRRPKLSHLPTSPMPLREGKKAGLCSLPPT